MQKNGCIRHLVRAPTKEAVEPTGGGVIVYPVFATLFRFVTPTGVLEPIANADLNLSA